MLGSAPVSLEEPEPVELALVGVTVAGGGGVAEPPVVSVVSGALVEADVVPLSSPPVVATAGPQPRRATKSPATQARDSDPMAWTIPCKTRSLPPVRLSCSPGRVPESNGSCGCEPATGLETRWKVPAETVPHRRLESGSSSRRFRCTAPTFLRLGVFRRACLAKR